MVSYNEEQVPVSRNLGSPGKEKRPHTSVWVGRRKEVTWILGGVGLSLDGLCWCCPCGIQVFQSAGEVHSLSTILILWTAFCLRELGPLVPTLVGH